MKRRHFILMLGGSSAGALSVGTGAFSSAEMQRGVNVSVVDDDRAFVGYESEDRELPDDLENDQVTLVTVKNQFAQEVTVVNATIDEGSEYLYEITLPNNGDTKLDPGDSFSITTEPDLSPGEEVEVAVTVAVEGTGVRAEVFGDTETRRFTIAFERKDPEVPEFTGNGNVFLEPDGITVEVLALYGKPTGEEADTRVEPSSEEPIQWNTTEHKQFKNAKPDDSDDFDPSNKLLAVYFVDRNLVYFNPNHDEGYIAFPEDWPDPKKGDTRGNN